MKVAIEKVAGKRAQLFKKLVTSKVENCNSNLLRSLLIVQESPKAGLESKTKFAKIYNSCMKTSHARKMMSISNFNDLKFFLR